MNNPKIALIPSGYKIGTPYGTVYSILPNDASQDFRLDRASSAVRVRKDGLIEETIADTPRLDWLNSNCPSLLRENQRTNSALYSQDFTQTIYWADVIDVVATKDEAIAPDGNYTANKIQANSGTNFKILRTNAFPIPSGVTMSMFVKRGNHDYIIFKAQGDYSFNLSTLQWGGVYSNVGYEDYGNGWIRLYATTTSSVLSYFGIYLTDSNFNQSWTAIGNEFVYVWGAQYEVGVGMTSYILTTTIPQTRNIDNLECTTTYTVGADATWYFDFEAFSFDSSFRQLFLIRNSAFTQYLDMISYESGGVYYMRVRASSNGGIQNYLVAFGEDAILNFTRNKVAVRLYDNSFEIYVNGVREYTGTASVGNFDVLNGLDILNDFGASSTAPSYKLYDFRVYDQTMTQSELEELTTL